MNKFFKTCDIENIDMTEIDDSSFGESLLTCAAKTKFNCELIDKQINCKAIVSYVPTKTTMEQCEDIVEILHTKIELIRLYRTFIKWYKGLADRQKKLYIAYFVKKDYELCRQITHNGHYHRRYIVPMSRDFVSYITVKSKLDENDLIRNPFIYDSYSHILDRKELRRLKATKKLEEKLP